MAMVWIERIKNYSTISDLICTFGDKGNYKPRKKNENGTAIEMPNPWTLFKASDINRPSVVETQDCPIPWNRDDNVTGLFVEWQHQVKVLDKGTEHNPIVKTRIRLDISPNSGWDYIRTRDEQGTILGRLDAGSLGSAPGINHSGFELVLRNDGKLSLNQIWRQSLTKEDTEFLGGQLVSLAGVAINAGAGLFAAVPQVLLGAAALV
jgi:hypothetical protein